VPELPEVETIRRQLAPEITGRTVIEAWGFASAKFSDAPLAAGATIVGLGRRGKYLLAPLDDDRELIVHLGMTGRLWVARSGPPPDDPYLRAWWRLADGSTLVFRDVRRFGRLAVVPAGDHTSLPTLHALGPEPFDEAFTAAFLHRALNRSSIRVKTQLLGQRVVAGVGNIYADEALWAARANPAARQISRPKAAALHQALRDALQAGLDNGGTTVRDYRAADGAQGRNQHSLRCYGRAGLPCLRCGEPLRRRVFDGRSTTWCPVCQR
jgi:formamidopyrimidine-DNA glycosylase